MNPKYIELWRDQAGRPHSNFLNRQIGTGKLISIDWGYVGKRPEELAKRMISAVTDRSDEKINSDFRIYQDLVDRLIQHLPHSEPNDGVCHCEECDQAILVRYSKGQWMCYDSLPLDDPQWSKEEIKPEIDHIYIILDNVRDWVVGHSLWRTIK